MRGIPVVDAPVHATRHEQHNSQSFIARHGARLVVESPAEDLPDVLFLKISLHRLRRLVEDLAVANRTPQLDVLRMCPDQRQSRTGRLSSKQLESRNVSRIPDLLRKQTTAACR